MARRQRAIGGLALVITLAALSFVTGQPHTWVRCGWEGRDGWFVENPPASLPEEDYRRAIRDQTRCVPVEAVYVDTDSVPEGYTVRPIGTRAWATTGDVFAVLVEAESGRSVVECGETIPVPGGDGSTLGEVLTCPGDDSELPPSDGADSTQ